MMFWRVVELYAAVCQRVWLEVVYVPTLAAGLIALVPVRSDRSYSCEGLDTLYFDNFDISALRKCPTSP